MKIEMLINKVLDVTTTEKFKKISAIKNVEILSANEAGVVSVLVNKKPGQPIEDVISSFEEVFLVHGFKNIIVNKKTDMSAWISIN